MILFRIYVTTISNNIIDLFTDTAAILDSIVSNSYYGMLRGQISMYLPPEHRIIAELPRAKRASEAPWVRKIGNPSSRENLVMTSPYVRTSVRPFVRPYRLWGRGGESRGSSNGGVEESFLNGIFTEKETHLNLLPTNDSGG